MPSLSKSLSLRKHILITLIGQDNYDKNIFKKATDVAILGYDIDTIII